MGVGRQRKASSPCHLTGSNLSQRLFARFASRSGLQKGSLTSSALKARHTVVAMDLRHQHYSSEAGAPRIILQLEIFTDYKEIRRDNTIRRPGTTSELIRSKGVLGQISLQIK